MREREREKSFDQTATDGQIERHVYSPEDSRELVVYWGGGGGEIVGKREGREGGEREGREREREGEREREREEVREGERERERTMRWGVGGGQ